VDVHDPLGKAVEERLREEVQVAGEDDEVDAELLQPGRHREVALLPCGKAVEREGGGRDPGLAGAHEREGVRPVRGDGGDR
jgi:hypothetical protein